MYSGEETDPIEATKRGQVFKSELSEREQKVASDLTNKSILIRQRTDEKSYYKVSNPNKNLKKN